MKRTVLAAALGAAMLSGAAFAQTDERDPMNRPSTEHEQQYEQQYERANPLRENTQEWSVSNRPVERQRRDFRREARNAPIWLNDDNTHIGRMPAGSYQAGRPGHPEG